LTTPNKIIKPRGWLASNEPCQEEDRKIAAEAFQPCRSICHAKPIHFGHQRVERQLELMARALAQKPRLLLLDKPTLHLDLSNKILLVHLLKELARKGVIILFTTHEPNMASALATHLVMMQKVKY
jgi:iron complex transport system ATP-binding protein